VLPSSEPLLSKKHPQHQKGDSSVKSTLGMRLLERSPILALLTRLRYWKTASSANQGM